ncbi:MAG: AAA family ATPase [Bacillota bacterium]|nr:AAA family ATPase [Bacillota bacterium]
MLSNLSVEFETKKVNVILGHNGAGKTTLFDLLTGVLIPSEGIINAPHENEIVYQLQGIPFLNILKGKDIVSLFLKSDVNKEISKITMESFHSLDTREKELLERLWNLPVGKMSLGEKRWLIVSLICQMDRKLYIFDEPTSGVDPDSRIKLVKRLEELSKKENTLVLMSTHILHELEYLDCILYLLHNEKIIFQGTYNEFLTLTETKNPDIAFYKLTTSI